MWNNLGVNTSGVYINLQWSLKVFGYYQRPGTIEKCRVIPNDVNIVSVHNDTFDLEHGF